MKKNLTIMKPIKTILALLMVLFFASANGQETHQYDFVVDGWGYSKGYQLNIDGPATYNGDTTKLALEGTNGDHTGVFSIPEMVEGYPVNQIGGWVGNSCKLSDLVIPNSIKYWMYESFCSCPNLASVHLGDSVDYLEGCFLNCPQLKSIYIGKGFKRAINSFSDRYSSGNQNNNIVAEITWNALNGEILDRYFTNLQILTLGDAVQTIPNNFMQNTQISTLIIPASVKTIGTEAFVGSSKLSSISVAAGNQNYDSRDDCQAIISKATDELILGCSSTVIPASVKRIGNKAFLNSPIEEISIPGSVSEIGTSAFKDCSNLKQVELKKGIKTIGLSAFANCVGIEEISIPGSVSEIVALAFSDCTGLKQVELNEGLTTIGVSAFAKCVGIEEIVFPSTVTTIEGNAFARCSSLKRIYLKSPRPAVITSGEYDTFEGVDKENCILYVPKGSLQTYWAASGWNEFAHIEEYDSESSQPLKGDVNGDGKVNVSDISTLINIILGIE